MWTVIIAKIFEQEINSMLMAEFYLKFLNFLLNVQMSVAFLLKSE